MIRQLNRLIVIFLAAVLLFACSEQEPVQIIITPTPDLTNITPSSTSTLTPSLTVTLTEMPPSSTPMVTQTDLPLATSTQTPEPVVEETVSAFSGGPIVGTDYVRPTFTPQ